MHSLNQGVSDPRVQLQQFEVSCVHICSTQVRGVKTAVIAPAAQPMSSQPAPQPFRSCFLSYMPVCPSMRSVWGNECAIMFGNKTSTIIATTGIFMHGSDQPWDVPRKIKPCYLDSWQPETWIRRVFRKGIALLSFGTSSRPVALICFLRNKRIMPLQSLLGLIYCVVRCRC